MLDEHYILLTMKPFINSNNELSETYFNKLFGELKLYEQYEVIDIMIKNRIEFIPTEENVVSSENSNTDLSKDKLDLTGIQNVNNENLENSVNEKQISETTEIYKQLMKLSSGFLCVMAQEGNKDALKALILKNNGFVYNCARKMEKKYPESQLSIDDLMQEGVCGVIDGMKNYDASRGNAFLTYAGSHIYKRMIRAIYDTGYTVRIPVHMMDRINKVLFYKSKYPLMDVFELSSTMNMDGLTLTPKQIKVCLETVEKFTWLKSLNEEIRGDSENTELVELIEDENNASLEEQVSSVELKKVIGKILLTLPARESQILKKYYGFTGDDNETLESISQSFCLSKERIRQLRDQALTRLRHYDIKRELRNYM